MLVSDLGSAAAYRTAGGEVRTYDDIGCLLADLADGVGHDVESKAIWVHDRTDGSPLRASEAVFVRSPALHTPMSGGLAAFADADAAATFVAESGGETVDFASMRASVEAGDTEGRLR
jgi:nitrous oxide reductase accessory protein NosL